MHHDKYHLPGMTYGEAAVARAKGRAEAKAAREALAAKVKVSPIAVAVAPLKNDAMTSAEQHAKTVIDNIAAGLAKVGMDREIYAPYPRSSGPTYTGRIDYMSKLLKYQTVHRLTRGLKSSLNQHEPDICVMDPEFAERFVEDYRKAAAAQYESFVGKLVHKIGDCETAVLIGNHVWSFSVLTVTKTDGTVENWQTQQITNRSVLGKYFPQWPSRKLKR